MLEVNVHQVDIRYWDAPIHPLQDEQAKTEQEIYPWDKISRHTVGNKYVLDESISGGVVEVYWPNKKAAPPQASS